MELKKLNLQDKIILSLASLLGLGFAPFLPGTVASLLGVLFFWLVKDIFIFLGLTFFCLGLAFFLSQKAEKILKKKDASPIVIDELAGMLVTFLFIPRLPFFLLTGFFLFRFFDIFKIPPANKIEEKKGSLAIVGDDIIAGIYANLILQLLRLLLKIS